jgi:hypothetical protein
MRHHTSVPTDCTCSHKSWTRACAQGWLSLRNAARSSPTMVRKRHTVPWPLTMVYNTSQHPCADGDMLPLPQPYSTVTRLGSRGCTSVWPQEPITCSSSWRRSSSLPWTPAALLTARSPVQGTAPRPRPAPHALTPCTHRCPAVYWHPGTPPRAPDRSRPSPARL